MSLRLVGGAAGVNLSDWKDGTARILRRFLDCQEHWFTVREISDHLDIGLDAARQHVRRLVTSGLLQSRRRAQRTSPGKRAVEYTLADDRVSVACKLVEAWPDLSAATGPHTQPPPDPDGGVIKHTVAAAGRALDRQAYLLAFSSSLSRRCLALLDTHGMHPREVIYIDGQSVSMYENVDVLPTWEQLRTLCARLGITPHTLLLEALDTYLARYCRDVPTTPLEALVRAQWGAYLLFTGEPLDAMPLSALCCGPHVGCNCSSGCACECGGCSCVSR